MPRNKTILDRAKTLTGVIFKVPQYNLPTYIESKAETKSASYYFWRRDSWDIR